MYTKIVKQVFLISLLLTGRLCVFSQISHEDSTHYTDFVKLNIPLTKDIIGKPITSFSIKDKNAAIVTNDMIRSKITFINFWFETCAPCVAEFQALEKFYTNNKSNENFQFISITFEHDSVIERVKKKNNLTYPIYHMSSEACRKVIGRLGYPATFIINRNLDIVYALTGGSTDPKIADKFLNYFIQSELEKQLK